MTCEGFHYDGDAYTMVRAGLQRFSSAIIGEAGFTATLTDTKLLTDSTTAEIIKKNDEMIIAKSEGGYSWELGRETGNLLIWKGINRGGVVSELSCSLAKKLF